MELLLPRSCDVLTCLLATQHAHPEDVYPEFPPQPQSLHPHAHDLQQNNGRWALTIPFILAPHNLLIDQPLHL